VSLPLPPTLPHSYLKQGDPLQAALWGEEPAPRSCHWQKAAQENDGAATGEPSDLLLSLALAERVVLWGAALAS